MKGRTDKEGSDSAKDMRADTAAGRASVRAVAAATMGTLRDEP